MLLAQPIDLFPCQSRVGEHAALLLDKGKITDLRALFHRTGKCSPHLVDALPHGIQFQLPAGAKLVICEDLARKAKTNVNRFPGSFFYRLRNLVAGGYYTTPVGMKDIGYIGNVPQAAWNGPPAEVLKKLKLPAQ